MEDRPMKVLLVEDNPGDARLIRERLREANGANFELVHAVRLDGALKLLDEAPFDVLLLDLMLPDSQGLDTLAKVRSYAPHVATVVLTGLLDEAIGIKAVKAGAQDYLVKGQVEGSLLIRALRYAIERRQSEEALERSLEKLNRTIDGIIRAMALTVEARDPYTAGHQRRVAQLACAIATEMRLSVDEVQRVRVAALLHDLGKICVPVEILSKPGRLSESELGLIRMHPRAAYDILKGIEFPWPIAQIVLQHHERMNGSGYPSGLRGGSILLEARIIGAADVVEAMTSHRPYRPAPGIGKALEEISQHSGILYDSDVASVCLKVFAQNVFRFEENVEQQLSSVP